MRFSARVVSGLVIAFVSLAGAICHAATIASTFDTDEEGWVGLPGEGQVSYVSAGGNPDGHIRVTDIGVGAPLGSGAIAPAKFIGDLSAFNGGVLSYDMATFIGGGATEPVFGTVQITGGGVSVLFDSAATAPPPDTWVEYVAPLTAAAWGVSEGDWASILADVTDISFSTEAFDGPDTIGVDNFMLTSLEPEGADHFMSYRIKNTKSTPKFFKFGPIVLEDQFGAAEYDVLKPVRLGLPADKNGEGVLDELTHFAEYKLKGRARRGEKFQKLTNVRVVNQCSDLLVEVLRPESLLVPTAKDLSSPVDPPATGTLDHYLCYKAALQKKLPDGTRLPRFPKGMQVEVTDQFQARRYDLKKITKLCNPVAKSGSPDLLAGPNKGDSFALEPATIRQPERHLVCYKAALSKKVIEQDGCGPVRAGGKGTKIDPKQQKHAKLKGIFVNNQLGARQLDTTKEDELCIPSEKFLPGS